MFFLLKGFFAHASTISSAEPARLRSEVTERWPKGSRSPGTS